MNIKDSIVKSLVDDIPNYPLLDQLTDHQLIADIMIKAGEAWANKGQEGREEWGRISRRIAAHCPKLRRVLRQMKNDQSKGKARFEPNYPPPPVRDLDPITEIDRLLKEANMTWTFDSGRNYTHPCTFCGTTTEVRELTKIGTYYNGETISRPVCNKCCSANVGRIIRGPRRRGNCYVAAEALYHLLGGKKAGWVAKTTKHEGDTHWWLEKRLVGHVEDCLVRLDPTVSQFKTAPDYSKGVARGFLTKQPSKRARELMEKIVWQEK